MCTNNLSVCIEWNSLQNKEQRESDKFIVKTQITLREESLTNYYTLFSSFKIKERKGKEMKGKENEGFF